MCTSKPYRVVEVDKEIKDLVRLVDSEGEERTGQNMTGEVLVKGDYVYLRSTWVTQKLTDSEVAILAAVSGSTFLTPKGRHPIAEELRAA